MDKRELIAKRIAKELKDGDVGNLGIGMPTMVANYIPEDVHVMLEAENGIMGVGPNASQEEESLNCIDAGGNYVTTVKGASYFDSAFSFSLIRGGHVDVTVLGALEVDEEGNVANWMIPGKKVKGMGGAMDLVAGVQKVVVLMEHCAKDGTPKIVEQCALPLTGKGVVHRIISDLGVLDITAEGIKLVELAKDVSFEDIQKVTGVKLLQ